MNKWNKFFEKQALESLNKTNNATTPPPETETEKAGENAEKELNEQTHGSENEQTHGSENETEQKGTEKHESSEQETGKQKETV